MVLRTSNLYSTDLFTNRFDITRSNKSSDFANPINNQK